MSLLVGYGRKSIHPKEPTPLGGMGSSSNRFFNNTLDELKATAIAFKDGEEAVILMTIDIVSCSPVMVKARTEMSKLLGIDESRIMITCTHTHSGPDMYSAEEAIGRYSPVLTEGIIEAAREALSDLAPAKLYGAKTETAGLNFVRHYRMNDGTVYGDNFGNKASGFADYATENDPEMLLMKIEREGKKDILAVNWQAHPKLTGGLLKFDISADFISSFRDAIERDTDMLFAFFLGAAGNQNPESYIASHKHNMDYISYGEKLADYAKEALSRLSEIEGEGIETKELVLQEKTTRENIHLLDKCLEIHKFFTETADRDEANRRAREIGLTSVYEAGAITRRPNLPETLDIALYATRIGGMAFTNAPAEMFSTSGKYVKKNSPFDMTFFITCSNNTRGYFATNDAYDYRCYESVTSRFNKGIAEKVSDTLVDMLNEIK